MVIAPSLTGLRNNSEIVGFKSLAKQPNVRLFTSCSEYVNEYQHILQLAKPLGIHPVFFDNAKLDAIQKPKKKRILYLGDAKIEKGFSRLPDLVERYLQKNAKEIIAVQYDIHTEIKELLDTELRLLQLAKANPNFKLVKGFLNDTEFLHWLDTAKSIELDYDEYIYSEKTSGLFWLAARRGLKINAPARTWMAREQALLQRADVDRPYFNKIFQPFSLWLDGILQGEMSE